MNRFLPRRLAAWRYWLLYALLFGLLLLLAGATAYPGDVEYWQKWSVHIFRRGLGNAYALPGLDYNPLYHYFLWAFGRLAGSEGVIRAHTHWLKAFTLLFDFGGALLAASFLRGTWRRFAGSLWLLLNVGYLYNTLIWQQVDAIYTALVLAAVVLALRRHGAASLVLYVLALNAKLQAIVLLPPLLLLWLPLWRQAGRQLALGLVAAAGVQLLVLAPFIWGGEQSYLARIVGINLTAGGVYPYVTVNAFNVWVLLMPDAVRWVPDTLVKLGLRYRTWGLLAFGAASAAVLLPLLALAWRRWRTRRAFALPDAPLVLLVCGLLPLVCCYFNTEMHERYWHPAVLFLGAYALCTRRWLPYALVSVGYVLNLHAVFTSYHGPSWLLRHPRPAALLFTAALALGMYYLYREARRQWSSPPPA